MLHGDVKKIALQLQVLFSKSWQVQLASVQRNNQQLLFLLLKLSMLLCLMLFRKQFGWDIYLKIFVTCKGIQSWRQEQGSGSILASKSCSTCLETIQRFIPSNLTQVTTDHLAWIAWCFNSIFSGYYRFILWLQDWACLSVWVTIILGIPKNIIRSVIYASSCLSPPVPPTPRRPWCSSSCIHFLKVVTER